MITTPKGIDGEPFSDSQTTDFWEYRLLKLDASRAGERIQDQINQNAECAWELLTFTAAGPDLIFIFRRMKTSTSVEINMATQSLPVALDEQPTFSESFDVAKLKLYRLIFFVLLILVVVFTK
ncbi:hypothetical protein ACO2I3_18815 [Leptospira interrogans]